MNGSLNSSDSIRLEVLVDIVREAGSLANSFFENQPSRKIEAKSPRDLVSDADRKIETLVRDRLQAAFPDIPTIGEELGGEIAPIYWSVDPIDGTSNFLSGLPIWAISVGLVRNGEPTIGVIFAPALGILASGSIHHAFQLEGLDKGSSPTLPPCFGVDRNELWSATERFQTEQALEAKGYNIVSLGSCAVSLMFVADGRLIGYAQNRISGLWDCAAGIALCRSAGIGVDFNVNPDGSVDLIAHGNPPNEVKSKSASV